MVHSQSKPHLQLDNCYIRSYHSKEERANVLHNVALADVPYAEIHDEAL